MQKDRSYHESAIEYNEELAEFAEELSDRLKSKYGEQEPVRWSLSVAKQHKFHAGRHRKALQKLDSQNVKTVSTEDGGEDLVVDDERIVHRSAVDGQFVSDEFADKHPHTTVEEHVSTPQPGADEDGFGGDAPEQAQPFPAEEDADAAKMAQSDAVGNGPETGV